MVDYYKILDIQRTAASSDVKKAYRRLALKWHPDKNPDNLEEANKRFKEISEAYEVLIDEKKRRMYDQYGKEGVQMPGDKRRHDDDDFDPFFATTFSFRNPDEVFREFFNGTPFQNLFPDFPGGGARRGVNRHMSTHPIDNSLSAALFSPFELHSFFNNSFGGVPFPSFNTFPGFDATSGGMAGAAVKRTSTSTRFINGKQITTKKIYENGKETILSYENDVLKSKTVNGVPQSIMLGETSTSSRQAPESPTHSTAACPNSKTVHGEHLKASRIKTHHHPLLSKKHDKRKGK